MKRYFKKLIIAFSYTTKDGIILEMSRPNFLLHKQRHPDFYKDSKEWISALEQLVWKCKDKYYADRECWYGIQHVSGDFIRYLKFVVTLIGKKGKIVTVYSTAGLEENQLLCKRI